MTASTPAANLGSHVFGVAAVAFGFITLAWHVIDGPHIFGFSPAALCIQLEQCLGVRTSAWI
jgi:hypothetical protein